MKHVKKIAAISRKHDREIMLSLMIAPEIIIDIAMIRPRRTVQRCLALAIAFLKPEGPRTVGSMIVARTSGTEISMNNFKSQR